MKHRHYLLYLLNYLMFTDEETGRERQDNLQESTYEGLTSTHVSLHFCKDFPEDSSEDI